MLEQKITLLISTKGERISRIPAMLLPHRDWIDYVVSWQRESVNKKILIPSSLQEREDVKLIYCSSEGLSANRNRALEFSKNKIVLICDDDCLYTERGLQNVIKAFQENPGTDILLFQSTDLNGNSLKQYPKKSFDYKSRPTKYYASSVEIALINGDKIPRFDKRFGLGAEFLSCGEEEVFLFDSLKRGCNIRYIPTPIVRTVSETTGNKFATEVTVRRSKGAVYCLLYGKKKAIVEIIKFAILHCPKGIRKLEALRDMYNGVIYICP